MALFNLYRDELFKQFGKKALYGDQLTKIGKKLIGTKYVGTYSQDTIPLNKSGYMIVNTDLVKNSGTHWVAIYSTKTHVYIYDTFGRKSNKLLTHLTKSAKKINKKIVDSDPDNEQRGLSEVCGILCVSWLLTIKKLGIKKAILV